MPRHRLWDTAITIPDWIHRLPLPTQCNHETSYLRLPERNRRLGGPVIASRQADREASLKDTVCSADLDEPTLTSGPVCITCDQVSV